MRGVARITPFGCCRLLPFAFAAALAASVAAAEMPAKGAEQVHDTAVEAIRNQIADHWLVVPGLSGADKVHVRIKMKLDRSGRIIGKPDVVATGGPKGTRTAIGNSAYRAVVRAAPFENLPFDKSAASIDIVVNFEPAI